MNTQTQPAVKCRFDGTVRAHHPERTAFEAWLMADHMLDATWNAERNCYDEFPAHLAFKAWQAARPKRPAVGAIMNVAAALAQRKPLAAFGELEDATHIGHRQFNRAANRADEDTRLLAVKLADALRAL